MTGENISEWVCQIGTCLFAEYLITTILSTLYPLGACPELPYLQLSGSKGMLDNGSADGILSGMNMYDHRMPDCSKTGNMPKTNTSTAVRRMQSGVPFHSPYMSAS